MNTPEDQPSTPAVTGPDRRRHGFARLALHPEITNVQASWVKLGPEGCRQVLLGGVDDLGGTLMNESISRAASARAATATASSPMAAGC